MMLLSNNKPGASFGTGIKIIQLENASLWRNLELCLVQGCTACVLNCVTLSNSSVSFRGLEQQTWLYQSAQLLSPSPPVLEALERVLGWGRLMISNFCFAAEWDHKGHSGQG